MNVTERRKYAPQIDRAISKVHAKQLAEFFRVSANLFI